MKIFSKVLGTEVIFKKLNLVLYITFLFFNFKFIRVTLVNKIIQVSSVQIYDLSSVYCVLCSSPKVKSSSITIYLILLPFTTPTSLSLGNHHTVAYIYEFLFVCSCLIICSFQFYVQYMNEVI